MKTQTFKNKIIKELIKANADGLHDVTYKKEHAKEFVENLINNIKKTKAV